MYKNFLCLFLITVIVTYIFSGCSTNKKQIESSSEIIIKGDLGKRIDNKLTPYIQNVIAKKSLPGLSIGIVKNNEIIYARAFGYENIETKELATISSFYHMASISKPFVATAIMQLVEQGKIDLDAPIVKYLPYFKLDDERYKKITIKFMLNHISGMPDTRDYEWNKPVYDEEALERYVRSLSQEKMLSSPGDKFSYSNMAFECLGDVIAKVSGIPFADYQKEYILNPSGMKKSTFHKPEYLPVNWAAPHVKKGILGKIKLSEIYPYNRMHGPSSTLHSNVLEMCQWAIININHGNYKNNKILNPESYNELWKSWFRVNNYMSVGLSWAISEYRGRDIIWHNGGDVGFRSNLFLLPKDSIAIVIMCNMNPAPLKEITYTALDNILDLEKL